MRRGTTPTLEFTTDIDLRDIPILYLTFKQQGKTVFEKTASDLKVNGTGFTVTLSQIETLMLDSHYKVIVQLRGKTTDGVAFASDMQFIDVGDILKDGVI